MDSFWDGQNCWAMMDECPEKERGQTKHRKETKKKYSHYCSVETWPRHRGKGVAADFQRLYAESLDEGQGGLPYSSVV
jgi:hypothetical protein